MIPSKRWWYPFPTAPLASGVRWRLRDCLACFPSAMRTHLSSRPGICKYSSGISQWKPHNGISYLYVCRTHIKLKIRIKWTILSHFVGLVRSYYFYNIRFQVNCCLIVLALGGSFILLLSFIFFISYLFISFLIFFSFIWFYLYLFRIFRMTRALTDFMATLHKNGNEERKLSKHVSHTVTDDVVTFFISFPEEGQYGTFQFLPLLFKNAFLQFVCVQTPTRWKMRGDNRL